MSIGALVLLPALLLPAPAGSPAVRENVVVTAERAPEPRESIPAAVSVLTRASWTLALSGSSRDREEPGPRTAAELAHDRFGSDPLFRFDRDDTSTTPTASRSTTRRSSTCVSGRSSDDGARAPIS
jgi:hypothetical protein